MFAHERSLFLHLLFCIILRKFFGVLLAAKGIKGSRLLPSIAGGIFPGDLFGILGAKLDNVLKV